MESTQNNYLHFAKDDFEDFTEYDLIDQNNDSEDEREGEHYLRDSCFSTFIQNGYCDSSHSYEGFENIDINASTVNPSFKVNAEDFETLNVIGRGGYGKVFLVRKCTEGLYHNRLFAMKVLKKACLVHSKKDIAHTWSERNILEMVKHPFLVHLYFAFQNSAHLYLILEYCSGGEFFTYLDERGTLSEADARFYISEVLLAVGHLHSLGIIYRDLKPENILLDSEGHIKLTDFGLSKEGTHANTYCGTREYMAPEIWTCDYHDKNVDWWCLGNLLYDMICGHPPFSHKTKEVLKKMICENEVTFLDGTHLSFEVCDLIEKLMRKRPQNRLGAGVHDVEQIMEHGFFSKHNFNWSKIFNKRVKPPFQPRITSDTDVNNFSTQFTTLAPVLSPLEQDEQIDKSIFEGFSYVDQDIFHTKMTSSIHATNGRRPLRRRRNRCKQLDVADSDIHQHRDECRQPNSTHSTACALVIDPVYLNFSYPATEVSSIHERSECNVPTFVSAALLDVTKPLQCELHSNKNVDVPGEDKAGCCSATHVDCSAVNCRQDVTVDPKLSSDKCLLFLPPSDSPSRFEQKQNQPGDGDDVGKKEFALNTSVEHVSTGLGNIWHVESPKMISTCKRVQQQQRRAACLVM